MGTQTVRLAVALQAGVAGGGSVEALTTALLVHACGGSYACGAKAGKESEDRLGLHDEQTFRKGLILLGVGGKRVGW
jgi:hypothetical protein